MADRLQIRLDAEHRRRLTELAEHRHVSISNLVRSLIDREYEAWPEAQRVRAASAISELAIEEVPDPYLLDQQLGETYTPCFR